MVGNPEVALVYIGTLKLLVVVLIAFVYSRAGRGWKIWRLKIRRRVFCPLILLLALTGFSLFQRTMSWKLLLAIIGSFAIYYGTMSVGYGAGSAIRRKFGKTFQQYFVGLIQGASCGLVAVYSGNWAVYSLCCIVPCLTLGAFGSWGDGELNASYKELAVGMSLFLFSIFLI